MARSFASNDMGRSLGQSGDQMLARLRQVPTVFWRRLCIVLLAIWLTFSLAQLFWLLMPSPDVPEPSNQIPQNAVVSQTGESATTSVDIAALKSYALFGNNLTPDNLASEPAAPSDIEDRAADTRLRLTLHGAMPSSDNAASAALIGDGPKQKFYVVGDELEVNPRGVKLAKVLNDRVILDNNGNYETLWLRLETEGTSTAQRRPSYQAPAVQPGRVPYEPADNGEGGQGPNSSDELVQAVRPEEGQAAPTAQQVKTITDVFNVSMYREGGQFIGYRIRPKGNRELFDQLGLQANDVVTAVNNVSLDDTNKAMQVYRSLAQESQATLEILRDGSTVTVDIALNQN